MQPLAEVDLLDPVLEVRDGQHVAVVHDAGDAGADGRGRLAERLDQLGDGLEHRLGSPVGGVALGPVEHPVLVVDEPDLDVGAAHVDSGHDHAGLRLVSASIGTPTTVPARSRRAPARLARLTARRG